MRSFLELKEQKKAARLLENALPLPVLTHLSYDFFQRPQM